MDNQEGGIKGQRKIISLTETSLFINTKFKLLEIILENFGKQYFYYCDQKSKGQTRANQMKKCCTENINYSWTI